MRGRFGAAAQAYERAAACGTEVQPGLARLRLAQGRPDAAAAGLDRALAESAAIRARPVLLAARVEVALATDELTAARRAQQQLAELVGPTSPPYLQAMAEHCAGAVLLAGGDPGGALGPLRRGAARWQEVGAPYEAARTRLLVAQACRELGDRDAADMEFDAARTVLTQLGALADLADLADLGDLATSVPSAPPADGRLSPRECEVLRLVATGATNRAIAERLVLSEKTVARHVSNIFGKLELTSRAAATAYAYEHGLV